MATAFDKLLPKNEVEKIIAKTLEFLSSKDFNIKKIYVAPRDINTNFMLEYDYDMEDVINIIKSISVKDYIYSELDTNDINGLYLHIFAPKYDDIKYIYLKYKITNDQILLKVISLHKNIYELKFPYK